MSSASWAYMGVGAALLLTLAPVSAREAEPRTPAPKAPEGSTPAASAAWRAALALRYAPVHHQDVQRSGAHALRGAADYIARYDFDGDLDAKNNWDHAGNPAFPLSAHAYFSVIETQSHWFVVYMFFHPRDWSASFLETEHENDSEGLLLAIARDGSSHGALKAAVTVAHSDFFSYVPAGSDWSSGKEDIDGVLPLVDFDGAEHPVTAQQAEGHGLKAHPHYDSHDDGIVYYPSPSQGGIPTGPNDRHVAYALVDLFGAGGLWDLRHQPSLFAANGAFASDASHGCGKGVLLCTRNVARAPWGWDDGDDGLPRGFLATNPAALVKRYFKTPERVSLSYTFNPYQ